MKLLIQMFCNRRFFFMIDTGYKDEVFTIREENIEIKIYELIDSINRNVIVFELSSKPIEYLLNLIVADKISIKTINDMLPERRDQPLIYTYLAGSGRIIDGNHRLIKRQRDGFDHCVVVAISSEDLKEYCEPFTHLPQRAYKRWFYSVFEQQNA